MDASLCSRPVADVLGDRHKPLKEILLEPAATFEEIGVKRRYEYFTRRQVPFPQSVSRLTQSECQPAHKVGIGDRFENGDALGQWTCPPTRDISLLLSNP